MWRLLLLVVFAGPQCAYAITPWIDTRYPRETVSVEYLYETCSVVGETAHGMVRFFDCESYVYGVLDSYLAIRESIPKSRRACFPATLPPWQALAEAQPRIPQEQRSQVAAPMLIEALRERYPCS